MKFMITPLTRALDRNNARRAFLHQRGSIAVRARHAAASLSLVQAVAARVVMEILGHSQISLTMNTYSHMFPSLQRDAASRMDAELSQSR